MNGITYLERTPTSGAAARSAEHDRARLGHVMSATRLWTRPAEVSFSHPRELERRKPMNITPSTPRRSRIGSIVAAVLVAVVASSAVAQTSGDSTPRSQSPRTATTYEALRDLVSRGLVPRQALEPARMSDEEQLRDLVNRGIVPRHALAR